jgi:hypothetical protein
MDSFLIACLLLSGCIISVYAFVVKCVLPRCYPFEEIDDKCAEPEYQTGLAAARQEQKLRASESDNPLNDDDTPREVKMAAVRLSVEFTRSIKEASQQEGRRSSLEVERLSASHAAAVKSLVEDLRSSQSSSSSASSAVSTTNDGSRDPHRENQGPAAQAAQATQAEQGSASGLVNAQFLTENFGRNSVQFV